MGTIKKTLQALGSDLINAQTRSKINFNTLPADLSKVSFVATVQGENFAEAVERACSTFHVTWGTMSESSKAHSRKNMALALLAALRKD